MPILSFIEASDLGHHTTLLTHAFDNAWATIEASGSPLTRDGRDNAREALAKWMIKQVQQGERNEAHLVEGAVVYMAGLKPPLR